MLPVSILLKYIHMFLGQSLKIIISHLQIWFFLHFILLAQCKTCDECKSMHLTKNFAYNTDYFLHPTPPVTLHSEKQIVWFFHFSCYPPILTVVCLAVLKRFMVHNHSRCACFQMGILHFHRNHRSIIAIITWHYTIIGISIQLSPIVVASPLPSSTSSTSSSRNVILFLLPSSSSYTSSFSLIIRTNTCTLTQYICTFCAC